MKANTKEDFLKQLEEEKTKKVNVYNAVDTAGSDINFKLILDENKNSILRDLFYKHYKEQFEDSELIDTNLFKIILKFQEFIEIESQQKEFFDNEADHIIEDGLHLSFMKGIVAGIYTNDEIILISQTFLEINEITKNFRQYS